MTIEIKVPVLGESITEATVGRWLKKPGESVAVDEPLVELETDKVTVEVPAPAAGVLTDISADKGATVAIGAVLAVLKEGAAANGAKAPAAAAAAKPVAPPPPPAKSAPASTPPPPAPAARKILAEADINPASVAGSGRRGQVLKEDAVAAADTAKAAASASTPAAAPAAPMVPVTSVAVRMPGSPADPQGREERLPMTRLRQTIARRLKDAQNTAAMLTTFNDVDMSAVMALRAQYKDAFERRHGVKLGFMGFFVKACIQALREIPSVNAEIDGTEIIYKNYYHIGVAVGTERGLVVPVVREADRLSLAEVEQQINEFGKRAREGKLSIEDMQGGTFTISNGGVYGSMLSTPILNAPQSGILGMHRIEERPVVRNGQVVARPMMYLALSYDHRMVDGKEAVTFLVRVKECLEDPSRFLLEV
ncbi:MAG: 2-oxoglutarate dehydrogenase complex dihydrolipoyllysine-residue succinyltransferase [Hyphomicrobium sp.]|nr:2-oxoglutarate dehydrogenase complex dihydrolipoyllysine-residue succinyltransferase [Hyphomicrobium sp.]